jgi:putative membrane protein
VGKQASRWSIALRGFLMGAADVVPGVSGGTMALILGIYPRFIGALSRLDFHLLREVWAGALRGRAGRPRIAQALLRADVPFLVFLGLGIAAAILSLSKVIPWLLRSQPETMHGLFFGMIVASVMVPVRMMGRRGPIEGAVFAFFAAVAFFVTGLGLLEMNTSLPFTFLSGAIAICAMILPGISGAFLLLIMGQYARILDAIHQREVVVLAVFGAGMVVGILSFSRLLRRLLDRYRDPTLAALAGLMVGSLRKIWPFKVPLDEPVMVGHKVVVDAVNTWPTDPDYAGPLALPLVAMAIGLATVTLLERQGRSEA